MDGRGRLAQLLIRIGAPFERPPAPSSRNRTNARVSATPRPSRRRSNARGSIFDHRLVRTFERRLAPILSFQAPRYAGFAASALLILGSVGFGVVRGEHLPTIGTALADARDATANTAGFRIAAIALSGQKQISREEILATAGITGRTSLLFLDVDAARERLKANPWIADATVLKLYPDRLQIGIVERESFAVWQKEGRLSVIARDGTVLEPYVARRFTRLPQVVGQGAEKQAEEFLALLDRYPLIRDQVRASILVADRRWNLRLKNGVDIRLPESEPEQALERLVALDRDKKLLSRDIVAIDLRLLDRVSVRLSDAAAQARIEALKPKTKKKGNDA